MQAPLLECLLPRELDHHKTGWKEVAAALCPDFVPGLVSSESSSYGEMSSRIPGCRAQHDGIEGKGDRTGASFGHHWGTGEEQNCLLRNHN